MTRRRRHPLLATLLALAFGASVLGPASTTAQAAATGHRAHADCHAVNLAISQAGSHGDAATKRHEHGHGTHTASCAGPCCACCATVIGLSIGRVDVTVIVQASAVPSRAPERPRVVGARRAPDVVIPFPAGPPTSLG